MSSVELNATAASLLGFLQWGPLSGYEIAAEIDGSIGNFWNVTRSQVYRELKTLESAGFVEVGEIGARERRPYAITTAGRDAFATWFERDPGETVTRSPLLLAVFFGEHMAPERLRRLVAEARARSAARIAEYRVRLPQIEKTLPFPALTMRFGLAYEEATIAWIDALPQHLTKGQAPKRA